MAIRHTAIITTGKAFFIHVPDPELSTAENILHLLRPDSKYTELEAKILDVSLVLHAEHGGGNNSTFTTHVVSSSGTDTYSTVAASLGSLKGPEAWRREYQGCPNGRGYEKNLPIGPARARCGITLLSCSISRRLIKLGLFTAWAMRFIRCPIRVRIYSKVLSKTFRGKGAFR